MERERKVWNEHKELLLAGERAKFEEEKTLLLKDLQHQLELERERSQRLEQKVYEAQMVFRVKEEIKPAQSSFFYFLAIE